MRTGGVKRVEAVKLIGRPLLGRLGRLRFGLRLVVLRKVELRLLPGRLLGRGIVRLRRGVVLVFVRSFVSLRRREKPPVEVGDEKLMFRVIRAAFNQRRKTLVNALSSQLGVLDKENAARVLVNCGFDTKIRGETVDIVGFAKISDEISSIIGADL